MTAPPSKPATPARPPLRFGARVWSMLRQESALPVGVVTAGLFLEFGSRWLGDLSNPAWYAVVMLWLFVAILLSAMAVVRHAEHLAEKLSEPLGTLLLTLSVIGIEVMMIAAVMSAGHHGNASLARDAMYAVVMIVMNGIVGLCLLLGGLRYHEQTYNLQGANAFLAVIVTLTVLDLVVPNFTVSSPGPTLSPLHSAFFVVMSVGLYGVFLAIQTSRHRDYFVQPPTGNAAEAQDAHGHDGAGRSTVDHALFLPVYLLLVVFLAEKIAIPIDYGIHVLNAPAALGGFLVSVLVLCPESLASVRAALGNQLQRCVNLLLGSVVASISLTIPAALAIGYFTGQTVVLGLEPVDMVLLVLTLAVSMLTFASARTNVLLGAVHLLLFLAYLMLIFEK